MAHQDRAAAPRVPHAEERSVIYVVFPAWNEERVIGQALRALAGAARGCEDRYHVVLVDDGSTDRTVVEAQRALAESGGLLPLTVLRHEVNRGLGAGLRTGLYWCLDHAGDQDVVVTLDADNTHPPALIPALVARLGDRYDLAIASRYRPGAAVRGVPGYRLLLSRASRLLFQTLFPIPGVRDYTCCFRAYRVPLLRRARLAWGDELCTARGFEAVMDLLLRLAPVGVQATEMGFELDYGERVGRSKMRVIRTIATTLALLSRRFAERFTVAAPARVRARIAAAERAAQAGDAATSRDVPTRT
jgi:dolichol-phosphate mannosyltransferase